MKFGDVYEDPRDSEIVMLVDERTSAVVVFVESNRLETDSKMGATVLRMFDTFWVKQELDQE